MSRWSDWILIADFDSDYSCLIEDDGPACYELGLMEPGDSLFDVEPMYIGETCNLKQRISCYASNGSHLYEIIDEHLDAGFKLCVRVQLFHKKEHAKDFQDQMLDKYDYDWNIQRNSNALDEEE